MTAHDQYCLMDTAHRLCICMSLRMAREDERERMTLPEWARMIIADARDSAETEVRERIAQAIEDFADDWTDWEAIAETRGDMFAVQDLVREAVHDAARIARGDQP